MAFRIIGVTLGDQILDHRHHLRDVLSRPRHMVGFQCTELAHIVQEPLSGFRCDIADRAPAFGGAGVDLVVNVGEVPGISHLIRAINFPQQPEQNVKDHHWPGIAQMGPVIHRGAADIHPHVAGVDRLKDLFLSGLRIVQLDHYVLGSHARFLSHAQLRTAGITPCAQRGLSNLSGK